MQDCTLIINPKDLINSGRFYWKHFILNLQSEEYSLIYSWSLCLIKVDSNIIESAIESFNLEALY